MTIPDLKQQKLLLFECISGSRAYGTELPDSDTDIKGVFVLPKNRFYGLDTVEQVNSAKNDEVYYELRRFAELLAKNNPNILEMLATPADCILYCHPLFEPFLRENFLSKRCKNAFAGFAAAQIKKARGLKKKINTTEAPSRKTPLDFCYVSEKQGSVPLLQWLDNRGWQPENCGLAAVPNMRDLFALYYDPAGTLNFSGIIRKDQANDIARSSIPRGLEPSGLMSFNKDAYSMHCREFNEYRQWLENRNETRYQNTLTHGRKYDAKNMMHTIRLLDMALEILESGKVRVRRPNREELLKIRRGEYTFRELMNMAMEKQERIEQLYAHCTLPETPDIVLIERLLVETRNGFYAQG